jgi:putative endonuclease
MDVGGRIHPVGMDGWRSHLELGAAGEEAALAHYVAAGYHLVARNWRCGLGELDLVLTRGGTLVVCEVKARRGSRMGGPFEAVTVAKQRKLAMLTEAFLAATGARPETIRFDVASVMIGPSGRVTVHLFDQAF